LLKDVLKAFLKDPELSVTCADRFFETIDFIDDLELELILSQRFLVSIFCFYFFGSARFILISAAISLFLKELGLPLSVDALSIINLSGEIILHFLLVDHGHEVNLHIQRLGAVLLIETPFEVAL
jgi:hypothetical protein